MKKTINSWIIAVCSSEGEGIDFLRFEGTEEEAKAKLADMVEKDKVEGKFESGSTLEELEVNGRGEIKAYANFSEFHIDYAAIRCKSTTMEK